MAIAGLTEQHAPGRLKDGDTVFMLKVPENSGNRFERWIFRVKPDGQPVFVLQIAPANADGTPGTFKAEEIRQNEYWRNYSTWTNVAWGDLVKKIVDSGIMASEAQLGANYQPGSRFPTNATNEETNYVIDADGLVTRSAKPATSEDYQKNQQANQALLGTLVNNLANPSGTAGTTGTATTTQKAVRWGLIAAVVAVGIFLISKFTKKKK